jgi:hypothetical protein
VKGLDDTDGETTIVEVVDDDVVEVVVVVDVSAARKGATTVTVATLTNTTTHSKTRILFIPKTDGYTNSPAGTATLSARRALRIRTHQTQRPRYV